MVLMNNKPETTCRIFLTGYQLFLFKGCRWFSGSFWPSWSTWTSCKFHHIITESASFATFVAVVTCVCFHQQGSVGQKGSKGSNVSFHSSEMPLVTRYCIRFLFNSFSFFFFSSGCTRSERRLWISWTPWTSGMFIWCQRRRQ